MFYDVYCKLCEKKGISPTRAALEIGLSRATPTTWKKTGNTPQAAQLQKIAEYFGVSVDYLLGNEPEPPADDDSSPAPSDSEKFFDVFSSLCEKRGISIYKACTENGLNRSIVSKWKDGAVPNGKILLKLADYFGVSVDYLLGKESFTPPAYSDHIERFKKVIEQTGVTTIGYGLSIQRARMKAGLSLQQLAEKVGLPLQQLELYEKNEALPTFDQLKTLASALGISLLDIMDLDVPFVQHCILEASEQEIAQYINTMIYATAAIKNSEGHLEHMYELYEQLNADGQQRALENLQDIAEIPKYQKKQDETKETENKDGAGTD